MECVCEKLGAGLTWGHKHVAKLSRKLLIDNQVAVCGIFAPILSGLSYTEVLGESVHSLAVSPRETKFKAPVCL